RPARLPAGRPHDPGRRLRRARTKPLLRPTPPRAGRRGRVLPVRPVPVRLRGVTVNPLDRYCPTCRAMPGEGCRNYLGRGCAFHRERKGKPPRPVQLTLWPEQPTLFGDTTDDDAPRPDSGAGEGGERLPVAGHRP